MRLYKGENNQMGLTPRIAGLVLAAMASLAIAPAASSAAPSTDLKLSSSGEQISAEWRLGAGSDAVGIEISPNGIKDSAGRFVDRYYYELAPNAQQYVTPHKFLSDRYYVQVVSRATGCASCAYEISSTAWFDHGARGQGNPPANSAPATSESTPVKAAPKSKTKKQTKRCARRSKKSKKKAKRAKRVACGRKSRSKLPQLTDGFGQRS